MKKKTNPKDILSIVGGMLLIALIGFIIHMGVIKGYEYLCDKYNVESVLFVEIDNRI